LWSNDRDETERQGIDSFPNVRKDLPAERGIQVVRRKVLLVELNEVTWDLVDPLIEQGKLPTFARLKREGAWAAPVSVDLPPSLSPGLPGPLCTWPATIGSQRLLSAATAGNDSSQAHLGNLRPGGIERRRLWKPVLVAAAASERLLCARHLCARYHDLS
jgi:hypothetical protein